MRRLAAALVLAAASLGCAKQDLIDVVMGGAPHPARAWPSEVEGLRVLSGDTHCHVAPPDAPSHVSRGLTDAIALAREERLDFVILTPHVRARFFADPALREHFVAGHRALQGEIARLPEGSPTVVAGFEYTDYAYGHAGLAFGDALAVLDRHSAGELAAAPERFFEAYAATGGLAVINHPAVVPVPSPFAETSADMSFRPFVQPVGGAYPPEITWLARHADAIETFNLGITYLRDRLVVGDLDATTRESHHLLDVRVRRDQRRIASVGGSDSHGMHLRAGRRGDDRAVRAPLQRAVGRDVLPRDVVRAEPLLRPHDERAARAVGDARGIELRRAARREAHAARGPLRRAACVDALRVDGDRGAPVLPRDDRAERIGRAHRPGREIQ